MKTILWHELIYYFRNIREAIYLYSYFVSIVLLVPFATHGAIGELQQLASVALWVALASGVAIGGANLYRRDREQGKIEYYQLLPMNIESIVFAKWLAFCLFILLPLLATLPIAALLYNLGGQSWMRYALGLTVGTLALSILSSLIAALTSGLEKAGAIMSLVILPLSIPVMIFGAAYCQQNGGLWQANLAFLFGFALLLLPIMCLGGAYTIRRSN